MKNYSILNTLLAAFVVMTLGICSAEEEKGKGKGEGRPGPGGPPPAPKLSDIDTDSSGDIDQEEWTAFQVKMAKERAERSFNFIAGDDGKISGEELKKMAEHRGGPGDRKGPGDKGPGDRKGKGADGKKGENGGGEGTKPKRPEIEE